MSPSLRHTLELGLATAAAIYLGATLVRAWTRGPWPQRRSEVWIASSVAFLIIPRVLLTGTLPVVLAGVGLLQIVAGLYFRRGTERLHHTG